MYIRKVKKSESKSQPVQSKRPKAHWLCISVKLKNLKANHNKIKFTIPFHLVVYIRKVKKSESKSQQRTEGYAAEVRLCISVKLKNLKANHNKLLNWLKTLPGCVYP